MKDLFTKEKIRRFLLYMLYMFLTLALQNCRHTVWMRSKNKISLLCNGAGMLLFIVSLQPYAAVFLFSFLLIKALMLVKMR